MEIAIRLANYAAGIVVRKSGVAVVSEAELIKEVIKMAAKIMELKQLKSRD